MRGHVELTAEVLADRVLARVPLRNAAVDRA
jgi:hypothetical protein